MSNLQNEQGIIEIAKALGLMVKYGSEQHYKCIDIVRDAFDVEQDKPFFSLKTMLENAHVAFTVRDMSFYEGKMEIEIPCPIMIREPFHRTKAGSRPAVSETPKWTRAKIICLVTSQPYILSHWKAGTDGFLSFQMGDHIIRKRWTSAEQVLPFNHVLKTLKDWAVPIKIVDDENFSYIVIKAENLLD